MIGTAARSTTSRLASAEVPIKVNVAARVNLWKRLALFIPFIGHKIYAATLKIGLPLKKCESAMARERRKGCQNKVEQCLKEFITEVYQILNKSLSRCKLSWKLKNLYKRNLYPFFKFIKSRYWIVQDYLEKTTLQDNRDDKN